MMPDTDFAALDVLAIQIAWALLILGSPLLCWRGARAVAVDGRRVVIAVALAIAFALVVTAQREDEPLHANGHAWREAREVLIPVGVRQHGLAPFMHGKGGIALQWSVAAVERALTGTANPLRISRVAGAAAAGAAAFLVIVLVGSPWGGLAAGCTLALMPLAQMLAVSGSALAIPAWLLPWSLGLLIASGRSGDRVLLVGAALAAALGALSHTAMLAWPPALFVAWLVTARGEIKWSAAAFSALLLVAVAWLFQAENVYDMVAGRDEGPGLLAAARSGFEARNLFVDPRWVSPALVPLVGLWALASLTRQRVATMAGSLLALAIAAVPFFAVMACSSDAVRYQGALLPLATSFAVAGVWQIPWSTWIGRPAAALVQVALLAPLALRPLRSQRPPTDPVAVEHRLVAEAARHMQPGTLVVLPKDRFAGGRVIADFPDFLLPEHSHVLFADNPRIATYGGPQLIYLGLACISWNSEETDGTDGDALLGMRPECRPLRERAQPWMVRELASDDLPRGRFGDVWTFHRLALGVPFGFFRPGDDTEDE